MIAQALKKHDEAIEILGDIGARCDLGEAYFERGLTHLALGKLEQAHEDKRKAIEIFASSC